MMNLKVPILLTSLVLLTGVVLIAQTAAPAARPPQPEPPLKLAEPVEAIVDDLERYIPQYMHERQIPGVAIALIKDGEPVWTEGFGVANVVTRRPVTPETVFEVASNSKVVTAYLALRLVAQGLLSLDEPLNAYLPEPWLPPSEYREAITLRHVLSHSSGLGHNTASRDSLFAPGRGYSYSAVGYQYLQAVIEEVTGQALEQTARGMVFAPLGMPSSSFVNRSDLTPRTANGHIHAALPAVIFAVLYLAALVIAGLIGMVIVRIRTGRWRRGRRTVIITLTVAFVLSLLPPFILFGMGSLLEFAWLIALCGLTLVTVFTLLFIAGRIVIARLIPRRSGLQLLLMIGWSALILVGLGFLAAKVTNLPVPKWPQTEAQAAGSMRATAGDLADFLIEIAEPQHLSPETAAEMQTSQVKLAGDLSWGLGPGIQHSRQGDALWQWGQHLDFQSIMIIYPEHGFGVVVCTNNDLLNPDVALEIAHRAIGGKIEPVRRAVHLEYNYREVE